jgi:hypothetical protein
VYKESFFTVPYNSFQSSDGNALLGNWSVTVPIEYRAKKTDATCTYIFQKETFAFNGGGWGLTVEESDGKIMEVDGFVASYTGTWTKKGSQITISPDKAVSDEKTYSYRFVSADTLILSTGDGTDQTLTRF